MPRWLKFVSIGCGGLAALSVLLVGCAIVLYGAGSQQNEGGQVSQVENPNPVSDPPDSSSTGSKTDPANFFGKSTSDPEVREYIAQNNCESVNLARRCTRSGVEITMDTGGQVVGIIYYIADNNLYQPYKGPLPGGVSVSDSKADVERKLGPPQNTGPDWAAYPPQVPGTVSLFINFAPRGGSLAPNSSIQRVSFKKYDPVSQRAADALLE